jgi:hypothetical protein
VNTFGTPSRNSDSFCEPKALFKSVSHCSESYLRRSIRPTNRAWRETYQLPLNICPLAPVYHEHERNESVACSAATRLRTKNGPLSQSATEFVNVMHIRDLKSPYASSALIFFSSERRANIRANEGITSLKTDRYTQINCQYGRETASAYQVEEFVRLDGIKDLHEEERK